jgi:hypothetical protein
MAARSCRVPSQCSCIDRTPASTHASLYPPDQAKEVGPGNHGIQAHCPRLPGRDRSALGLLNAEARAREEAGTNPAPPNPCSSARHNRGCLWMRGSSQKRLSGACGLRSPPQGERGVSQRLGKGSRWGKQAGRQGPCTPEAPCGGATHSPKRLMARRWRQAKGLRHTT